MYGNSVGPPSRSAATVVTLRVLFAVAGFLTCGLLACVPLFRVAVLRGRWYDWAAAWLSMPVSAGGLAVVGSLPETDPRTDAAMAVLLLLGAASTAYFLVVDVRAHAKPRPFPGYPPRPAPPYYGGPGHPTGHGGRQAGPYAPAPVPYSPRPPFAPPPPAAHTPVPAGPPVPTPPPHRPAPARIDQVRAELDELSDYLRKHDSSGGGSGDGGAGRERGGGR